MKYAINTTKSHRCPSLPFATTDCSETCGSDPVWSSIDSHTKYAIIDSGMIHLFYVSDTFPPVINPIKPDMVDVGHPVVVNVEFADLWYDFRWRGCDGVRRGSSVPSCDPRRAGRKWSLLFERG